MYSEMSTKELLERAKTLLKRAEAILISLQAKCEQREAELPKAA